MQTRSGFAEVGDARLYYEREGDGPPVLLIHAANTDARMWDGTTRLLRERRRIIRYDMRGMGRSGIGSGPYTIAGDLDAVLGALEIQRCTVVGASAGGYCALEYALARPERVAALVLVSAGLFGSKIAESDAHRAAQAELEAAVTTGEVDRMAEAYARMWLDGPGQPPARVERAIRERFLDMARIAFSRRAEYRFPELMQPGVGARLDELDCPTLVVDGEHDFEESRAFAELFASSIRGARRATIPGAAHLPPLEQPGPFVRTLDAFLAALPAA